jgi:IS5 family transposase
MKRTEGRGAQNIPSVAMGGASMLGDLFRPRLSEFDLQVFNAFVPPDHYLRRALEVIPWHEFEGILARYYSPDLGRPPELPVLMLKLEFLRYHHNLSDHQVIHRATTDLAFRYFLQVDVHDQLPHPSSLCRFRGRLGKDGFREVFDKVVATAREYGLVKDRLRIKDASHVIADIAIPTTLALVAKTRDQLLEAAEPFDPVRVEGERINIELLRESSKGQADHERLVSRVTHLREMLAWIDELPSPEDALTNRAWQTLRERRQLAHKIFDDQQNPNAADRTLSTTDPDARCGKHGQWFHGYLTDILIDADSEIITQVNVLPANGDEAADALELIGQEQAAHANHVQAMSIDGVGFNGPLLRQLEDPAELNIDTYVPPPKEPKSELFTPEDFEQDPERGAVTCPAGQTSKYRFRDPQKHTTKYRFEVEVCQACALLSRCMKQPPRRHGRTVCKSDYQAEHDRVRQKATTPQYAAVRREHPKVERKLAEVMNRHGGRRARYRGRWKVLMQELMACTATNVKRVVRLLCAPSAEACSKA